MRVSLPGPVPPSPRTVWHLSRRWGLALFESSRPHQPGNINNASSAKWESQETKHSSIECFFSLSKVFYFISISARCELSQNRDLFSPALSNIIVWFRREENTSKHFLAVNTEIECQLGKQQDGQDTKLMHCEQTSSNFFDSINTVHLTGNPTKTAFMVLVVYGRCVVLHLTAQCGMWWCHATPGDNTGAGDTRGGGCYAANGAENIENIDSARWAPALRCCQESLSAFASAVTCGGGGGGMSDAYQVLMADTQRGRPPGPASRVCVCYAVTEARGRPCVMPTTLACSSLSNYVRPVLKIADMSSFYARAYVNLVQAAPPTAPPDTLVAKSLQNMDTFTKSISVLLIAVKSTNNWDK